MYLVYKIEVLGVTNVSPTFVISRINEQSEQSRAIHN